MKISIDIFIQLHYVFVHRVRLWRAKCIRIFR